LDGATGASWTAPEVGFNEIGAALGLEQRSAAWTAFCSHVKTIVLQGDGHAFAFGSDMISSARLLERSAFGFTHILRF